MQQQVKFIQTQFEYVKSIVGSTQSRLIKQILSILGYKYTSLIKKANFFHFATEAWIITVLNAMKKQSVCETTTTFPSEIRTIEISEEAFIQNIEVLIGTGESSDNEIQFSQSKISKLFINNINQLRLKLPTNKDTYTATEILEVLQHAVNFSINELSTEEGDEKSLAMFNLYKGLKDKHREKLTFDIFIAEYQKTSFAKQMTKNLKFSVQNPCEIFYYFAETSFEEFIHDIKTFTLQSSNIFSLIQANLHILLSKNYEKVKALSQYSTYPTEKMSELKFSVLSQVDCYRTKSTEKFNLLKEWVSANYTTCQTQYPALFEKLNKLNENYLTPLQKKMIVYYNDGYTFAVKTYGMSKEKFTSIRAKVTDKVTECYSITKEQANKYMKIVYDKVQGIVVIQVIVDRLTADREKLVKFIGEMRQYIAELSIEEMKKIAKESMCNGKEKIMSTYRKFLCAANPAKAEVEIEDKEVIDAAKDTTETPKSNQNIEMINTTS